MKEVAQLVESLAETKKTHSQLEEKVTTAECHLMEVTTKSIVAFKQSVDFYQVVLQLSQKVYQLGFTK